MGNPCNQNQPPIKTRVRNSKLAPQLPPQRHETARKRIAGGRRAHLEEPSAIDPGGAGAANAIARGEATAERVGPSGVWVRTQGGK